MGGLYKRGAWAAVVTDASHANAEHWHDKQLDLAPRKDQDDRYDERVSPRRKASRK